MLGAEALGSEALAKEALGWVRFEDAELGGAGQSWALQRWYRRR